MAISHLSKGMDVRARIADLNYWHYVSLVSFLVGLVAALGEWVFFWWADPGQYLAVGGFLVTILGLGFAASKSDVRKLDGGMQRLLVGQDRLVEGQDRLVEGQDRLVDGQDRLVEGQTRLVEGQDRLVAGQERQTHLLEQVVTSFRGRQGP